MSDIFREAIFGLFKYAEVSRVDGGRMPVLSVAARRDENLDLRLELTSSGAPLEHFEGMPAGSVYTPQGKIECLNPTGGRGTAFGVVRRARQTVGNETVETFSANSVEWEFERGVQSAYVVEWVLNVPDQLWPDQDDIKVITPFTRTLGSGEHQLVMTHTRESFGGRRALFLQIDGIDLYVARPSSDRDKAQNAAQIIYRGRPDQEFRDKIRNCLSFVLGGPFVYLGHTEYDGDWSPTFMRSVDAHSADGAYFRHVGAPPYPMHGQYYQLLERAPIERAVAAIFARYDDLNFRGLSWAYWHAVCAPVHSRAVHFGGLIEQLRRSMLISKEPSIDHLIDEKIWSKIEETLFAQLRSTELETEVSKVLRGKISNLNRTPTNLALKRVLKASGLELGDAELGAWRHRNRAAHGGRTEDSISTILSNKLLQVLFHRMLAAVTKCADLYVDIYNIDHPVRPISQPVPARP